MDQNILMIGFRNNLYVCEICHNCTFISDYLIDVCLPHKTKLHKEVTMLLLLMSITIKIYFLLTMYNTKCMTQNNSHT